MANAQQTRTFGASFDGVARLWENLVDGWAKRGVYHRTVRELTQLSDRELDDLGISRADIETIARDTAFGPAKTEYRPRW